VSTTEPRPNHALAQIYLVRALDPIIEIARAVSEDFVRRPHLYTRIPDDVASLLADFRALPGAHPDWPNAAQRAHMCGRIVSRFSQSFAGIRLSAIRFIKSVSSPGEQIARNSFIELAALLRASAQVLEGTALSAVERANSGMLNRALTVLSSSHVSAAFGVAEIPGGGWPQGGLFSPQLGFLCESVSHTLALQSPVKQPMLSTFQRAAHYGAGTIAGVLDASLSNEHSDRVADIVQSASAWALALLELLPHIDIARTWRDPSYRASLHCLQRDIMPPHPSGEISLEGTVRTESPSFRIGGGVLGYSTDTVENEACCSTGDYYCPPDTNGCPNGGSDDHPTLTLILI
jgi:mersacidin/lichenicidin family type 2 lantibiotic